MTKLIKTITSLNNEMLISRLESLIVELNTEENVLLSLSKPMRERLDVEELIKEQNYKHPSKESLDKIIEEADIEVLLDGISVQDSLPAVKISFTLATGSYATTVLRELIDYQDCTQRVDTRNFDISKVNEEQTN